MRRCSRDAISTTSRSSSFRRLMSRRMPVNELQVLAISLTARSSAPPEDAAVLAPSFDFPADADDVLLPRLQIPRQVAGRALPDRARA